MSEERETRHGSSRLPVTIVGFGLFMPLLYVLGLGPAVYIHKRSPEAVQTSLEVVYAPLEWAFEYVPDWIAEPYGTYLELFSQ